MKQEVASTDVLILGGGGAGLRAALEARRRGAEVLLLSKAPAGGASCTSHGAGYLTYCAAGARDELRRQVLAIGGCVNDCAMVEAFVEDVPTRIPELAAFGVELAREEVLPGLGYWRTAGAEGQRAGYGLTAPLRKAVDGSGAAVLDGASATRLLVAGGAVVGAVAYQPSADSLFAIAASATVLATGGGAALWARSDNPRGTTGDGFALALDAGAALANMEFVSFQCPDVSAILDGTADRAAVLERGAAHYFLGGVAIDAHGRTTVDGLLAAGEVACGPFGAARLGGSAMAEIIVFGARAGCRAAERAAASRRPTVPPGAIGAEAERLERLRRSAGGPSPAELRRRLAEVMWSHAGLVKDAQSLGRAARTLEALGQDIAAVSAQSPDDLLLAEQTRLSRLTALEVVRASLWREESRGAFWRLDHPRPDNSRWLLRRRVRLEDGEPAATITPASVSADAGPAEPPIGAGCFGYLTSA